MYLNELFFATVVDECLSLLVCKSRETMKGIHFLLKLYL